MYVLSCVSEYKLAIYRRNGARGKYDGYQIVCKSVYIGMIVADGAGGVWTRVLR